MGYQDVPFSGFCSGRQRHRSRRGSPPGPRAPAAPLPQHPRAELGEPLRRPPLREEDQGRLPPSPPGSWVSARRGHRLAGWSPPDSCPAVVAGRSSWRPHARGHSTSPGGGHQEGPTPPQARRVQPQSRLPPPFRRGPGPLPHLRAQPTAGRGAGRRAGTGRLDRGEDGCAGGNWAPKVIKGHSRISAPPAQPAPPAR